MLNALCHAMAIKSRCVEEDGEIPSTVLEVYLNGIFVSASCNIRLPTNIHFASFTVQFALSDKRAFES